MNSEEKRVSFSERVQKVDFSGSCMTIPIIFEANRNGVGFWRERQGRDRWDADEVSDRLFVGSFDASRNTNMIQNVGISHIVRIMSPGIKTGPQMPQVRYLIIRLNDDDDSQIKPLFRKCSRFIARALANRNNRVLVHCVMGISRSVSLVCAYLMKSKGWSAQKTLDHIRMTRLEADPNAGFRQQLVEYEWGLQLTNYRGQRERKLLRNTILQAFQPNSRHLPVHIIISFV